MGSFELGQKTTSEQCARTKTAHMLWHSHFPHSSQPSIKAVTFYFSLARNTFSSKIVCSFFIFFIVKMMDETLCA